MSAQIVYLSHGGGPLPILGDEGHRAMVTFMKGLPARLRRPKAIVVFSAHWEEEQPTVITDTEPGLLYDYYGFPPQSYAIEYPATTDVPLAEQIVRLLGGGRAVSRGWDHGVFIPLLLCWPEADIPIVQVSQLRSLDAREHYEMGARLRSLLDEEILFVGSGFSFHNIRAFGQGDDASNDRFQEYLITAATHTDVQVQKEMLIDWQSVPGARYCHPREEHLLSLHICAGLGQRPAQVIYDDAIMGRRATAYQWG